MALVLAIWGATDVRVRATVDPNDPGLHKTDFTVYTEAGAAFFDGRDPYSVTNLRGWGYLYPPLFAILVAPLHALHPQAQAMVWFALSVLMLWGCHRECVRIARVVMPEEPERVAFGPIPDWLGYAATLAIALPAMNCLQRGQVGVAKLYLLMLGFRLLIESRSAARSFLAGGILALPIVLKVTPLVPVSFALFVQLVAAWHTPRRAPALARAGACATGVAFGLIVCVFLLPAGLIGWRANLHHLATWRDKVAVHSESALHDDFAGDASSTRNQSFANAVHRFGNWADYYFAGGPYEEGPEQLREGGPGLLMDAPIVDALLVAARVAAGCLLLVVGYRMARAGDRLGQTAGFGLACVLTLIVAPIARGHYYVMLLPAVVFAGAWLLEARHPRLAVGFALAPVLLVVTHYAVLAAAGRVGLLGIGTTLWYAATCAALLRLGRSAPTPEESADRRLGNPPAAVFFVRVRAINPAVLGGASAGGHKSSTELSR
jgi:hypothetical protein